MNFFQKRQAGYKHRTIRGIGWAGFLQLLTRGSSFLKIGIAAFILSPESLGIYGLTILLLSLVEIFSETGTQIFLIQQEKITKKLIGTLWIVNIFRGITLCLLLILFSYPGSVFFNQPSLFVYVCIISLIPLIKGFENPYVYTLQKKLHFQKEFLYRAVYVVSDMMISLLLLSVFVSVSSLIVGVVISNTIGVFGSWIILKKKPVFLFSKSLFNKLKHFVRTIAPLNIVHFSVTQIDSLYIGKMLGVSDLGVYQVTQRVSSQPLIELSDVFGKVTLPVYSKIKKDRKRLEYAYKRIVITIGGISVLAAFGIYAASYFFIRLLGPSWSEGIQIIPYLLSYGVLTAVWGSIGSLFFSLFSHGLLLRLALFRLIILIPCLVFFGHMYGLVGVGIALVISMVLIQPITYVYISKILRS